MLSNQEIEENNLKNFPTHLESGKKFDRLRNEVEREEKILAKKLSKNLLKKYRELK